jgi:hypothetical protein
VTLDPVPVIVPPFALQLYVSGYPYTSNAVAVRLEGWLGVVLEGFATGPSVI